MDVPPDGVFNFVFPEIGKNMDVWKKFDVFNL
jgi:hypothetical protein